MRRDDPIHALMNANFEEGPPIGTIRFADVKRVADGTLVAVPIPKPRRVVFPLFERDE